MKQPTMAGAGIALWALFAPLFVDVLLLLSWPLRRWPRQGLYGLLLTSAGICAWMAYSVASYSRHDGRVLIALSAVLLLSGIILMKGDLIVQPNQEV